MFNLALFIQYSSDTLTTTHYGEVQFFFQVKSTEADEAPNTVAMISKLTPKYDELRIRSHNTLILATYEDRRALTVIPVSSIRAVIAAPPAPEHLNPDKLPNLHYIVDRLGFDVSHWNLEDVNNSSDLL